MKKYLFLISSTVVFLSSCSNQNESSKGLPWWVWLLLIAALILILCLLLRKKPKEEPKPEKPEDLKLIEGIGPKIQSVLHAAGINTFSQLADMTPDAIKDILIDAGLHLPVTDTWPQQARLAAEGKLDELKAFQDELIAGREQ